MGWGERQAPPGRHEFTLEDRQAVALSTELLAARRLFGEDCIVRVEVIGRQLHLHVGGEDGEPRYRSCVHHDGLIHRDRLVRCYAPDVKVLLAQFVGSGEL